MKKSLTALAVLVASGASFAEATITGQIQMGYQALHTVSGGATGTPFSGPAPYLGIYNGSSRTVDTSGLGVDTANIYFTVSEDLGGGQTLVAKQGFDTVRRGSVAGGDTVMTYTNNSFGQIELGSVKDSDVFSGVAYGSDNLITFDGRLNQIETSSDYISYAAPIGPFLFKFIHSESSNGLGLGTGTQGAAPITTQGNNTFILAYLKGPLTTFGAYRSYNNQDEAGGVFNGNGLTKKSVIHVEAGYDFGRAKVGLGVDHVDANWGFTQDSVMVGVSVPVGAWLFSGAFESVKANSSNLPIGAVGSGPATLPVPSFWQAVMAQTDGTANGISLAAQYNLSKRSNVAVKYSSWMRSGYAQFEAFGITQNPNEFGYKDRSSDLRVELTTNF
jgi:hypothetical protein